MKMGRQILYWFGLITGAGLFIWQFIGAYRSLRSNTLPVPSLWMLVPAWIVLILLICLQMINWQQILQDSDFHLKARDLVGGYTLSFLPRYIPGSVWGYISRAEWLYQKFQISFRVSNFSSMIEILITVVTSFMVTGVFFAVSTPVTVGHRVLLFLLVLALPVCVWLLIDRLVALKPLSQFKKISSLYPQKNISLRTWLICILIMIGQWLVLGASILLLNGAFYQGLGGMHFFTPWFYSAATFAFSLAWLVGFLILFVPAGIGVRELVLTTLLFMNLSISFEQATLVAVLSRGVYSLAEIFWIVVGLVIEKKS